MVLEIGATSALSGARERAANRARTGGHGDAGRIGLFG